MRPSAQQWLAAVAGLAAMLAQPAVAQLGNVVEGRLAAQALHDLSPDAAVAVDVLDDADTNLQVQRALIEALSGRGRVVTAAPDEVAAVVLEFATTEIFGVTGGAGPVGEIRVDTATDLLEMRMSLWSSTRDGLLSGRSPEALRATRLLRLEMVARRRGDGRVVWQGFAYCESRAGDPTRLFVRMAPALARHFGLSAEVQAFTLVL